MKHVNLIKSAQERGTRLFDGFNDLGYLGKIKEPSGQNR